MTLAPLVGSTRAAELLDAALTAARADALEVSLAARRASVLRFAGGCVHQPQDLASLQIMVRAVVGSGAARVAVSSPALLADAVERACAQAARTQGGGHLPADADADADAADSVVAGRELWSESTLAWDGAARAADIAALHRLAAGTADPVELAGTLAAAVTELAVHTTQGIRRYGRATEASLSLTAFCGAGSSHADELGRAADSIDAPATGGRLIDEAARMAPATELAPGRYDVVFGPSAVAELIGFVPSLGFDAPSLIAGIGLPARRAAGQDVPELSPLVTVADDATGGPGLPFPFDMEGVTRQRVELVRNGRIGAVVSDLASAEVTGGSTGHAHVAREEAPAPRAANLRLEAGRSSEAELIAGVERGVWVQRLWYTRLVDAATATITGTTRDAAFEIRDGRLGRPIAGMRFTESVLDALARADGVGDRIVSQPVLNVWNGAASAPALRVRGFRLGIIGERA